jgi:hypothetical protein
MLYKIRWGWDRWKIMDHPKEEIYRIKQQIQYRIIDKWWYTHLPSSKHFVFDDTRAVMEHYSVEGLRDVITNTTGNIKNFRLLNTGIENIVSNNCWNYDFKNSIQGQKAFVHNIDDFNYMLGEIKYVYELSRLYHIPILAAYAIAVSDGHLLRTIETQLHDWLEQNPFLGTTAWKSGNVVGIRAVNLVVYRLLLSLQNKDYIELDRFLSPLIELHYKFLISHQSLYSSKGNHHIGELAGLIAISTVYKFKDSHKVLLQQLLTELESETLRLIHADGFNKEQATRYQASYINLIVTVFRFAKLVGFEPSLEVMERIERMYTILDTLRIAKGEFFHVGDDDNAELIYPYFDKEYNVYESMLNDATVLFGSPKKVDYHFDLRNYILWGDDGVRKYKQALDENARKKLSKLYPDSGYFVVKDEHVTLLFDVGEIGIPPSMNHGHSDILNLLLYIDGIPILVDSGSYQYNTHYRKMRDYFHGVHSHNTISVDGLDQAKPSSGMFWLSNPQPTIIHYSEDADNPICEASHNGYQRKGLNVTHQRKIDYKKGDGLILIYDTLFLTERHEIAFYLHFHPMATVKHENSKLIINENITIENPFFEYGEIIKGNETIPLGWYSERYDAIEPTCSFVLRMKMKHTSEMITRIKF